MFDRYFCPRVSARLRAGPHAALLESFLGYLHHRGHKRSVCQRYLCETEIFIRWLQRRHQSIASITTDALRTFACRGRTHPRADTYAALRHFLRHLQDLSIVPRPIEVSGPIELVIAAYDAHLRDVAGLAQATRFYRRRYAHEFLVLTFGKDPLQWDQLRPEHIVEFIARYGRTDRTAAARVASVSLRNFLRWLQVLGRVEPGLIATVPTFRRWRHTVLPRSLTNSQYDELLATFDRTGPVGRRDYAITVCMGDLGLRCGEVADLMLADLDENAGTLRIAAGKTRRGRVLPMTPRVRQAVITYVRESRSTSGDCHLFLRHRTPSGLRISRLLIRGVIIRAFAKVTGFEGQTGTHILRHTAATRLHRAGADLKRVADILGHASIDTTAIYAKVDLLRLTAVAMPWLPEGEVKS